MKKLLILLRNTKNLLEYGDYGTSGDVTFLGMYTTYDKVHERVSRDVKGVNIREEEGDNMQGVEKRNGKKVIKEQETKNCEHEFVRENLKGEHYSNGAGFCKKCGVFKSGVFPPETLCKHCHKPTNHIDLTGELLCKDCQRKLGVLSYGYCRFLTENYLKSHFRIDKFEYHQYSLYIQSENLEAWYYLIPTVDKGIYKIFVRNVRGTAKVFKHVIFQTGKRGLAENGYFSLPTANILLKNRYNSHNRNPWSDNLKYVLEAEGII